MPQQYIPLLKRNFQLYWSVFRVFSIFIKVLNLHKCCLPEFIRLAQESPDSAHTHWLFSWTLILTSIKLEWVTCCWADTAGFDKQELLTGLYDSAEKYSWFIENIYCTNNVNETLFLGFFLHSSCFSSHSKKKITLLQQLDYPISLFCYNP